MTVMLVEHGIIARYQLNESNSTTFDGFPEDSDLILRYVRDGIGYRHNKILIIVCRETKNRKKYSQNIFCFDVFCEFEF